MERDWNAFYVFFFVKLTNRVNIGSSGWGIDNIFTSPVEIVDVNYLKWP